MTAPLNVGLLAAALLALPASAPPPPPARAYWAAETIAAVTDDPRRAAALAVTLVREGGINPDVETCRITTPTGHGAWQLNPEFWAKPIACGHPIVQAYAALRVLDASRFDESPARALQLYLGASSPYNREARIRLSLWTLTAARLECACSF